VLLPLAGTAMPSYPLHEGYALTRDFALPILCLCCAGYVTCVHFYDLARLRVQARVQLLDKRASVSTSFCFSPPELQESYERWRFKGALWRAVDWLAVLHMASLHIKVFWMTGCDTPHQLANQYQLWAMAVSSVFLARLLFRETLSSFAYSVLSLVAYVYIWISHILFLAAGDVCFGGIAQELYRGPIVTQTLMACAAFCLVSLVAPVSQAFVPIKTVTGFFGCLISSYMHTLFRDEAVNTEVDSNRWGFFWMYLGVSAVAMAYFHFNTRLSEAGMSKFLTTPAGSSRQV